MFDSLVSLHSYKFEFFVSGENVMASSCFLSESRVNCARPLSYMQPHYMEWTVMMMTSWRCQLLENLLLSSIKVAAI